MIENIEASIINPDDRVETTLIANVASVGTTRKLSTGQILTWDEESLRKFAPTLVGTPVNVALNAAGLPTAHSHRVVGAITKSFYNPTEKSIQVLGSLWNHYYPETISRLREIYPDGKIESSIEFLPDKMKENEDGSVTPLEGRFSGLGLVGEGADLGQRVLWLASADEGVEEPSKEQEIVEKTITYAPPIGSYEWTGEHIAEYLANRGTTDNPVDANIIGTFANSFVYNTGSNTYQVTYGREDDKLVFGEPVQVETTFVPLEASREDAEDSTKSGVINMPDEKEFAELKASRDNLETELADVKKKYDELLEAQRKAEAESAAEVLASTRIDEIAKIRPYDDEALKAEHKEIFKTADDKTYEQFKKLMMATVEDKGGIAPDGGNVTHTDAEGDAIEAAALKNLPKWKEELLAQFAEPTLGKK